MTRLRFSSAEQVIETYPILSEDLTLPTNGDEPFTYIDRLLKSQQQHEVLAFCAFLLPRKEAVQWLCKAIRATSKELVDKDEKLLNQAEDWARTPNETARQKALQSGMGDTKESAAAWAALAAGWSGGSITNDVEHPLPPPAHLTGLAVKLGLRVLLAHLPQSQQAGSIVEFTRTALQMLKQDRA
jgi:hypothetical protein